MDIQLDNVHQKLWFFDVLPFTGRGTCHAIYPNIYVPRSIYVSLHGNVRDYYSEAVILHEQRHLTRMKTFGIFKWYLRYIFSPKFRVEEEIEALKPQLSYIKSNGLALDLQSKARTLSGWLYLWPESYETIYKQLSSIWDAL